ncbi:cell division protein Fic [Spirochaetia bacterium]|nr:cell division protein Fic [Spirochaetia bacterium]
MDNPIEKLNADFETNQRILRLIAHIDHYKGEWNIVEKRENRYLRELRVMATAQSIGSSTRIEGSRLEDDEIQELLKNIKITKMETRDEQEVVGYYDVLELIYENYGGIKLSESYIKQLHQLLLKYSDKDTRHRGNYKSLSNQVAATYPDGKQRIIFATTESALVEGEMYELTAWTNRQFEEQNIHPLLVIAFFIYEFLSIHPFQDGNGRLSRLLTTLCLLQHGYGFIQYISFENHIEAHKTEYYEALMDGQRNRGTEHERIHAWLIFFLESLKALTEKLDQKYSLFKSRGGYLNDRQILIRDFIDGQQPLKFSDLALHFPNIPEGTLKKDLQYLRDEKIIITIGQGRGTVYITAPTGMIK